MAQVRTFETSINLSIWDGDEHEFVLRLGYKFTPGYPDTHDEPGSPDTVEIISIRLLDPIKPVGAKEYDVPTWMQGLIDADEELIASLIAHAEEQDASDAWDAAERRAEEARDDRMTEAR